jgi:hypothetical protein
MHNPHFMVTNMEHHKREQAHLDRHAWKRPRAANPEHRVRRALNALRGR